ncbi:MAG: hypothetical protein ACK4P8_09270 [Tabrizicola sp.]
MKYAAVGAAIGYFLMVLSVAIAASGESLGFRLISKTMIFLEMDSFGGATVFDWKLLAPVVVGLLAGLLYSADKS